jgi:hypothetical protein
VEEGGIAARERWNAAIRKALSSANNGDTAMPSPAKKEAPGAQKPGLEKRAPAKGDIEKPRSEPVPGDSPKPHGDPFKDEIKNER